MYKYLLCLRYLRTRDIALASIISVTLGVATMIVVNSVMEGFTSEMQNRIHGILADVVVRGADASKECPTSSCRRNTFAQRGGRRYPGDVAGCRRAGRALFRAQRPVAITRQVDLIGIDEETQSSVSDFGKYLQHPANREKMSFQLREDGYDVRDHQADGTTPERSRWTGPGGSAAAKTRESRRFRSNSARTRGNHGRPPAAQAGRAAKKPATKSAAPSADPFGPPASHGNPAAEDQYDPEEAVYRRGARHCHGRLSRQGRRGPLLRRSRRRRENRFLHRRPAAENRERQLHDHRFLRKQDERKRRRSTSSCRSASCRSFAA